MKVSNLISSNGNKVANQFEIVTSEGRYFQSYDSVIVFMPKSGKVILDKKYWNYSVTTSKYRNSFLGEDTKTTKSKIESGEYLLKNLNS